MVSLTNATPSPPQEGKSFSVTAAAGSPGYTFQWRVGTEGEWETVTQDDPTLTITVPGGSAGKSLNVRVKDGEDDTDADGWIVISPPEPPE